jgi:hypothetical protein
MTNPTPTGGEWRSVPEDIERTTPRPIAVGDASAKDADPQGAAEETQVMAAVENEPRSAPPVPPAPASAGTPTSTATGAAGAGYPPTTTRPVSRGPRRARLRLTRIDPWSVMKNAFLLSIAFAVVTVVAVGMVWQVLGAAGVWDAINDTVQEAVGGDEFGSFQVEDYVGTSRVLGFTMLVAAIDVILITAAATLTAFLYNMGAALLGGVEVTLSEDAD